MPTTRRTALKRFGALAAGATLGALAPRAQAHAKRKRLRNGSRKGYVINNEAVSLNRMLSPEWGVIGWGAWLKGQWGYRANFKWSIALADYDPSFEMNAENMAGVMAHPHYDGWWILLREPDLNNSVDEAAELVNAQIPLIRSYDPDARFCVSFGTGRNPVYRDGSYGKQLWGAIDDAHNPYIQAKGFTYYPYDQAPQLNKFLKQTGAWKPGLELWILEYGIGKDVTPTVTLDGETPFTVTSARAAMEANGVTRDAWYAEQAIAGTVAEAYVCLLDANENITAVGAEWLGN